MEKWNLLPGEFKVMLTTKWFVVHHLLIHLMKWVGLVNKAWIHYIFECLQTTEKLRTLIGRWETFWITHPRPNDTTDFWTITTDAWLSETEGLIFPPQKVIIQWDRKKKVFHRAAWCPSFRRAGLAASFRHSARKSCVSQTDRQWENPTEEIGIPTNMFAFYHKFRRLRRFLSKFRQVRWAPSLKIISLPIDITDYVGKGYANIAWAWWK